jgi:hypothetical protein
MGQFTTAISGMSLGELRGVLQDLMTASAPETGVAGVAAAPSRRRPRRPNVVTYRVRIDLKGTRPPLWRRLELSSDLSLSEMHQVIQEAFGWTDSHLHQFASDPDPQQAEFYLCPFQVDEGDIGIPEEQVRLDEVLADPGDKLYYDYDFGDGWQHVIKLETVSARTAQAPRACCTDGRRDGPAEDCGGVGVYELMAAAGDADDPDHEEAAAELKRYFGGEVDPEDNEMTRFDIGEINAALAAAFPATSSSATSHNEASVSGLPALLGELVSAIRDTARCRELLRLLGAARLDEPVLIDADTAARMVGPYRWLLDRVGTGGIKLTGAGYLPPSHVEAAMAELEVDWIGKANREVQTAPVLHLRESAMKMGLLRKHRGTLLATPYGRSLRGDPVGLWWHLAERMPFGPADRCETQAGLLLLTVIAAGVPSKPNQVVARLLSAIGWNNSDGTRLTGSAAAIAAWDTSTVLRRIGGFSSSGQYPDAETPTPDGVNFARAALQTWSA